MAQNRAQWGLREEALNLQTPTASAILISVRGRTEVSGSLKIFPSPGHSVTPLDIMRPREGSDIVHEELGWIEALAPDFLSVLRQRYQVLRMISWASPIGRRTLAAELDVSERVLRTETDFLRRQRLIDSTSAGMVITTHGREVLQGLENFMNQLVGIHDVENQLTHVLGVDHVMIVSGNCDTQPKILDEMGALVNQTLNALLPDGRNVVAVMGGNTMGHVATALSRRLGQNRQLMFVPARGGIGERVDIQANTICAEMARSTGGEHRALYLPDNVSADVYEPLLKEPSVRRVLDLIGHATAVVHSVGDALVMAKRREMDAATIQLLQKDQAVGEAFGYFFNEAGQVVYKVPRIGLQVSDLQKIPYVVCIAGGASKGKAIKAYMHSAPEHTWLITDEGAAKVILNGATL